MINKLQYKSIELKQETTSRLPDGRLKVVAYAAVFGNVDSYNDIIVKGAFKNSLKKEGKRVAVCYQHEMSNPIATLDMIKEDDNGLLVEFTISKSEEGIATKIEEGIIKEMSIGYRTIKYDYDTSTEIRTINELRLYEVSLVTRAANEEATIKSEEDDNNTCTWVVTATDDEKVAFYNGAETKADTKFDFSKLKSNELEMMYKQLSEEILIRLISNI